MICAQTYDIGRPSFSEMARTVLDSLKELYGEYKTILYTNSEAYENEFSRQRLKLVNKWARTEI